MSTALVSLIIVYNFVLVYVVFRKGRKVRSTLYFWLVILAATLWAITILVTDLLTVSSQIVLWSRLSFATSALVVLMLYFFSRYFPDERLGNRAAAILALIVTALFVVLSLTDKIVLDYTTAGTVFSWGQPAFLIFMLCGFSVSLYQMYCTYRRLKHTPHGFQILYVLLGLSISIGFAGGTNLVLPLLHIAEIRFLGPLAMVVFLTLTTYAIVKHRLMDIRLVLRKSFIYAGLSVFVFVAYYVTVWVDQHLFGGLHTPGAYMSAVVITPLFLVGFSLIGRVLRHIANKYFFTGLYDYQGTVDLFASRISQTLHLHQVTSLIVETIQGAMRNDNAAIALRTGPKVQSLALERVIGFEERLIDSFLKKHIQPRLDAGLKRPVVAGEPAAPTESLPGSDYLKKEMKQLRIAVILPLVVKGTVNSLVLIGEKLTREAFTKEDMDLLKTLANQASVAVENARLYSSMEVVVAEQTRELHEKNRHLQDLLKMKSEFLSIASHQLRTPLTAIRGLLSMQADGDLDKLPAQERKNAQLHMLESANRLSNIVNDLLDAMELEGGNLNFKFATANLIEIIENTISELKPNYDRKGLYLNFRPPTKKITIESDSRMLREALENVIDNAEKYTNKGGVDIGLTVDAKKVTIAVRDTGIGIPETDKPRLFLKFSRGEKSTFQHTDGSGLGLFIARNVIHEHHGEIQLDSPGEGKGTTVTITLPLHQPKTKGT
ncbi:MAG: ATP-binding protein [candidate division Zixibacteria bacterium]|jgi:signal transduction histidine kinase|nr:ATP-binding protein [candidate division Zixibacteria bacterium]